MKTNKWTEPKWRLRFLNIAKEVSSWSKDPSSKVGSIAVSKSGRIISTGYNGFPSRIKDDKRLSIRQEKYKYVVHAEKNCIYNATAEGISLKNSVFYVYGRPVCSQCAIALVSVGASMVVMQHEDDKEGKWAEEWNLSKQIFEEADFLYLQYDLAGNKLL